MKSVLAHTLFGLSLAISVAAEAGVYHGTETFEAEFQANVSTQYQSATASINYATDVLELTLQPVTASCEPDGTCPEPIVYTLENTSSEKNSCGIIITKAKVGDTRTDGVETVVTLRNNQNKKPSCGNRPEATLTVKQEWYNRIERKYVKITDTFATVAARYEAVIRAELEARSNERYWGGSLFMDGRNSLVELTVQPVMPPCPAGMMCAQVMPQPVTFKFANAKTTRDPICLTVETKAKAKVNGKVVNVTIYNNHERLQNNPCPTFAPLFEIEVTLDQDGIVDNFKADDFAMIKPGK